MASGREGGEMTELARSFMATAPPDTVTTSAGEEES
jgi:hypothetical protein